MTKGEAIESVFLRITGGKPSTDSNIIRADISVLVAPAVNASMVQMYYEQIKAEGDRDLPGTFFAYYHSIPVLKDADRLNKPYIIIPVNIVPMASNRGIRHIVDNHENTYKPVNNGQLGSLKYWAGVLDYEKFYRTEGKKHYLYNMPPITTEMNAIVVINSDILGEDDQLPIPAGMEMQVLDTMFAWVSGTKQIPADYKVDSKDIN